MRLLLTTIIAACIALPAAAQYPEKPVTMLAGYPPGGLVDVVARLVAEGMKPKFPRGLNVVNRPGAAGSVAVAELVRAAPGRLTTASPLGKRGFMPSATSRDTMSTSPPGGYPASSVTGRSGYCAAAGSASRSATRTLNTRFIEFLLGC